MLYSYEPIFNILYSSSTPPYHFVVPVLQAVENRDIHALNSLMDQKQLFSKGLLVPAYAMALMEKDTESLRWLCSAVARKTGPDKVLTMGVRRRFTKNTKYHWSTLYDDTATIVRLDTDWDALILCAYLGTPDHYRILTQYPQPKGTYPWGMKQDEYVHRMYLFGSEDCYPANSWTDRFSGSILFENGQTSTNLTPLSAAIYARNDEMIDYLISLGTDAGNDVSAQYALYLIYNGPNPKRAEMYREKLLNSVQVHSELGCTNCLDVPLERFTDIKQGNFRALAKAYKKEAPTFFESVTGLSEILESVSGNCRIHPLFDERHYQVLLRYLAAIENVTGVVAANPGSSFEKVSVNMPLLRKRITEYVFEDFCEYSNIPSLPEPTQKRLHFLKQALHGYDFSGTILRMHPTLAQKILHFAGEENVFVSNLMDDFGYCRYFMNPLPFPYKCVGAGEDESRMQAILKVLCNQGEDQAIHRMWDMGVLKNQTILNFLHGDGAHCTGKPLLTLFSLVKVGPSGYSF